MIHNNFPRSFASSTRDGLMSKEDKTYIQQTIPNIVERINIDINKNTELANSAMQTALDKVSAIVFNTKEELDAWLLQSDNVASIKIGTSLLIKDMETPDYWWDGTQLQILETQKVDLSNYLTNTAYINMNKIEFTEDEELKELISGSTVQTLFGTISKSVKTVIELFNKIGNTDISDSGNTITNAIKNISDNYLKLSGGIMTGALNSNNIQPTADIQYNLGSNTKAYNNIYGKLFQLYADGILYGYLSAHTIGTTDTIGESRLTLGNINPSGTSGNSYGKIILYGTNTGFTSIIAGNNSTVDNTITLPSNSGTLALITDTVASATKLAETRSITLAGAVSGTLEFDGGEDKIVEVNRRHSIVGQINDITIDDPWYKFASVEISEPSEARDITFFVRRTSGVNFLEDVGILRVHIHTNDVIVYEYGVFEWFIKSESINIDDFVLAYYNDTDNSTVLVELWVKCETEWSTWQFDVISEGSREYEGAYWTLYNNKSEDSKSEITPGYTQVKSVVLDLSNNSATATKASQDIEGNIIDSTYLKLSGGTMTGQFNSRNILPAHDSAYYIGSESHTYLNMFSGAFSLYSNTNRYGFLGLTSLGTVDNIGEGSLILGNNIASGFVGNAIGKVYLYGTGTGHTVLSPGNNSNSDIELTLPSTGGALALADHSHISLVSNTDNRSVDTIPNDYNNLFKISGLKLNNVIGNPDDSIYSCVLGVRGWSDNSGGNSHEFALTGNGGLFRRHGGTTSWGTDWIQMLDSSNYASYCLPLSGGAMTGNLILTETKNILLRNANATYRSGIGYDTSGNECIAIWATNTVTRLRWYAGKDMSNMAAGTMMSIIPDFEISKASGTAIGYIAGNTIIHSGNYTSYCATAGHTHYYLTAGDEINSATTRKNSASVALVTGGWANSSAGYGTSYGTTLDISGYSTWYHRLAFHTSGQIDYWQGINTTTMTKIGTLITSANYTSYTVTKTGGGASGTWGISISGNATSATKATQDGDGKTISSTYLKLSGGTLTGALNFKNSTLNLLGDDVYFGDQDIAGCMCIKGANGATGINFIPYSGSVSQKITINGSGNMTITGSVATGTSSASGSNSFAEGMDSIASGICSHAEGYNTKASKDCSHAEGNTTEASEFASHAEGYNTKASNECSHAEGNGAEASGHTAHAEGGFTKATINCAHAEGNTTEASGFASHAEGVNSIASGFASHAGGNATTALQYQYAIGCFNDSSISTNNFAGSTTGTAFVIGNGADSSSRSNAFRVQGNGVTYAKGAYNSTGADYAEFFEWADGNPDNEDRRGYFVTFDDNNPNKIRKAKNGEYILGIISGNPCVVGNSDESWLGRYIMDDFGAFIYEEREIEVEYIDEETDKIKTKIEKVTFYKENPNYDPERAYTPRTERKEWDYVGMMGVLSVWDDGTCKPGGYCKVTDNGTATASERAVGTYRVIERVNENIIKVVFTISY